MLDQVSKQAGTVAIDFGISSITVEAQAQWAEEITPAQSNLDAADEQGKTVGPIITCSA